MNKTNQCDRLHDAGVFVRMALYTKVCIKLANHDGYAALRNAIPKCGQGHSCDPVIPSGTYRACKPTSH